MNYNKLTKQELIRELESCNKLYNEEQAENERLLKLTDKLTEKITRLLDTNIKDLITTGHDNHEEFGFELAKEYLRNQNQDFNKLKKRNL